MSWNDLPSLESDLALALDQFDWTKARELTEQLVSRVYRESRPLPLAAAKRLLSNLRRKRLFDQMTRLAEALMRSGQPVPIIRRQYAQSLIDRDMLLAPELVLNGITQDSAAEELEQVETRGLMGRIYKQLYVNHQDVKSNIVRTFLGRALSEYLYAYRLNPNQNLWHGINVVALVCRAKRDGVPIPALPDPSALAQEILAVIELRERNSTEGLPPYDVATALEALLALGRLEEAESRALEYSAHKGADFFEIYSTFRQFKELWLMNETEPPGSTILPILAAAILRRHGGLVTVRPDQLVHKIEVVRAARIKLEKAHGLEGTQSLQWIETGLGRARSVARIEKLNGMPHGTGWVVRSSDLFLKGAPRPVLITNAHVVGPEASQGALLQHEAMVHFQRLNQKFAIKEILWSSRTEELDTTVFSLEGDAQLLESIPIWEHPIRMTTPASRVYIIGHPGGRDLEFSFYDNRLIALNDFFLHYRTPTEAGSSGSPVFESADWRAIGLHHKGDSNMPRLDGEAGVYEANEGVGILAIREAIRAGKGSVLSGQKRDRMRPAGRKSKVRTAP